MSDFLTIQLKQGKLRTKPSFLGKIILTLPYGTRLEVKKKQGDWFELTHIRGRGWMHKSALTSKEIVLKAGAEDVKKAASDDELVLAGKGFSEDVEKSYRKNNPEINFANVDDMEKYVLKHGLLADFVQQGSLG